jgi:hypothetical protein
MPHFFLPTDHTDADLVLAADVATAVSSADLYVTWTIVAGAGAPEVEAVVTEEPAPAQNAFVELFAAIAHGVGALWRSITGPPLGHVAAPQLPAGPRAGEPTA